MDADPAAPFGALLRRHRLAAGLSQQELAERAGLSLRAVGDLERGVRQAPYPHTVRRLAEALGLDAAERVRFTAASQRRPDPIERQRPAPERQPPTNLPLATTNLIGREHDLAEVARLLGETRLLTLTGAGGCGKTRLAVEAARSAADAYRDGVWLVELAALADPALVPQAAASALGVREQPGRPLTETLAAWLTGKHMLLVLDNCEHLIEACSRLVAAVLRTCPRVTLLATSRERLNIAGETVWRVPSLDLPEPDPTLSVERARRAAAIQLFVERAVAVAPDFTLTPRNVAAVAEICRRLDGIPLAIELAATRVAGLAVEQIAARLDDRFRLLTEGDRAALPRQQTLIATIHWSHDLLTEPEQALFRRLAVFAGSFTLAAAEAVGADPGIAADEILGLLLRLVEKSLVVAVAGEGGAERYRLLETLRQYGQERLLTSGETDAARRRHADYYVALAEAIEPVRWGARQAAWLAELDQEHDNLRAALGWATEWGDSAMGMRLSGAVYLFWIIRGSLSEGRAWLVRVLAGEVGRGASDAESVRLARAKALHGAGVLAREQGDYAAAQTAFAESLDIRRAAGDRWGMALTLQNLGRVIEAQGEVAAARAHFEESLVIFRELGDGRGTGWALSHLGALAWREGDLAAARVLLEESLALARAWDDTGGVLSPLGRVLCALGDVAAARALLMEDAVRLKAMGSLGLMAWQALDNLACLAAAEGEPGRALRLCGAAEVLRDQADMRLPPSDLTQLERLLAPARRALSEDEQAAALAAGRAMTLEQAVAYALGEESAD